jgi:hypothetical protein
LPVYSLPSSGPFVWWRARVFTVPLPRNGWLTCRHENMFTCRYQATAFSPATSIPTYNRFLFCFCLISNFICNL